MLHVLSINPRVLMSSWEAETEEPPKAAHMHSSKQKTLSQIRQDTTTDTRGCPLTFMNTHMYIRTRVHTHTHKHITVLRTREHTPLLKLCQFRRSSSVATEAEQ